MSASGTILVVDDNRELAELLKAGIEARGRHAVLAGNGQQAREALARLKPVAAVVDLLLPDVMGSEILDQLANQGVPAIAMTGVFKGARYALEMQKKHGARAFMEKPFSPAALFQTLDEIIGPENGKWEDISEDDLPAAEVVELVEEVAVPAPGAPQPLKSSVDDRGARTSHIAAAIEISLEPLEGQTMPSPVPEAKEEDGKTPLVPAPPVLAEEQESPTPAVPISPVRAAPPEPALELTGPVQTVELPLTRSFKARGPKQQHTGDLAHTSVPRLLVAFAQDQETGELILRKGKVTRAIVLRHGRPVSASSNLKAERFGAFAVAGGYVDKAKAEPVLAAARAAGQRSATALVEAGLLDDRGRRKVTEALARQIIFGAFAWEEGTYELRVRQTLPAGLVPLSLSLPELILQGARGLPLVRLRKLVPVERSLAPAPDPAVQLHELVLDASEATLVAAADGTKAVRDLLRLTDLDERPALALLYALCELGLLAETERVMASTKRMGFL